MSSPRKKCCRNSCHDLRARVRGQAGRGGRGAGRREKAKGIETLRDENGTVSEKRQGEASHDRTDENGTIYEVYVFVSNERASRHDGRKQNTKAREEQRARRSSHAIPFNGERNAPHSAFTSVKEEEGAYLSLLLVPTCMRSI